MILKRQNLVLILLSFLILATRLSLFNPHGQYFFGDEIFYKRLVITLQQANKSNDPILFWQGVFGIYARPGFGIIYSLPIWLEAQKPDIPYGAMLNMVINISMVLLIYLTVKKLVNTQVAVLATIAVVLSISSIIYVRHMMPYDASLALLILALYVFVRTKSTFFLGTLSSLSFLTYPSYSYYLIPLPFLVFIFSKSRIVKTGVFGIGLVIPILLAQLFSLVIGAKPTYFEEAKYLSGIVTQGDFMPALSFLTEYVKSYDGVWGMIIITLAPFIIFLKDRKKFLPLTVYLILIFLILEIFSYTVEKTVLYGRTIRPFYLLLLISGVIVFENFLRNISKKLITRYYLFCGLFIFITFVNWWPNFNVFKNLIYPGDVRQEAEKYLSAKYKEYIMEDVYTKKETVDDNLTDPPTLEPGKFYLVNPTLLYPYFGSLDPPCKAKILIENEHALVFKPYRFEGFTRKMRGYLTTDPPKYRLVYCN